MRWFGSQKWGRRKSKATPPHQSDMKATRHLRLQRLVSIFIEMPPPKKRRSCVANNLDTTNLSPSVDVEKHRKLVAPLIYYSSSSPNDMTHLHRRSATVPELLATHTLLVPYF